MSWPWKTWSWYGKWEDEEQESEATKSKNWWSKKDPEQSEYTGELTDQETGATVVTKGNVQKRKNVDPDTQDPATTKAALRERIFAQHGASTLMKEDLEKIEEDKTASTKEEKGESSTKRTRPRGKKTGTASEDESTAVGSEHDDLEELTDNEVETEESDQEASPKKWEWIKELTEKYGIDWDALPLPEHRCPIFNGRVRLRQKKQKKRAEAKIRKILEKVRNSAGKDEDQLKIDSAKAQAAKDPEIIERKTTKMDKIAYFAEWYRGEPQESETHDHDCCGCKKWFPVNLVMIMTDRPDFDWQGFLPRYCFRCLRHGPGQWDSREYRWKKNFDRNLMVHPCEFGHDKADKEVAPTNEEEKDEEEVSKGKAIIERRTKHEIRGDSHREMNRIHKEEKTAAAKDKALAELAQVMEAKKKEAMQTLSEAIWTNAEYTKHLQQRLRTLNKGAGKPSYICGYDENGEWKKFLSHIVSDAEAAKFWTRLVKSLWTFRGRLKSGTLRKARTTRHYECMAHLKMQYPGESNAKIREKCAGMMMHNILNQISTVWDFTPEQRLDAITALEWWDMQLKQGSLHPTLIQKLDEEFCPDLACQYEDRITESLMQYFLCRSWDCLWMGRSTEWAISNTGGRWACIRCRLIYQAFGGTQIVNHWVQDEKTKVWKEIRRTQRIQAQKVMCIKKNSESAQFVKALQAKLVKDGLEDSNFLEGMLTEASRSPQAGQDNEEWLFCPCEWTGTETQNAENALKQKTVMKGILANMREIFTKGDPMEIHHAMAVTYAHLVPGFLDKVAMTQKEMDEYDKWQSLKAGEYKVPKGVREAGCHYGRYMKKGEYDFIMTKENVVFFFAHMRAALAIMSAHNLVFETGEEKKKEFAKLVKSQMLYAPPPPTQ